MVEWGMGSGRVPERSLCSGADYADGGSHFDCALDAAADFYDGAVAVFALAGSGGRAVRADGIGSGRQRRGHEYPPDGANASAVYGTRAEHFLFLWNFFSSGAGAGGGGGLVAGPPWGGV